MDFCAACETVWYAWNMAEADTASAKIFLTTRLSARFFLLLSIFARMA